MTDAYTTDVDFPSYFVREQAPIHMATAAALWGRPRPFDASGFTYCDFGCGAGLTVNLLAAANPGGPVLRAWISIPIIFAQRAKMAERGGLTNITFYEGDFTTLAPDALPDLDYAAISGVFSWVRP